MEKRSGNKKKDNNKLFLNGILIALFIFAALRFIIQQPILNNYNAQIKETQAKIEQQKKDIEYYEDLKELYSTDEYKEQLARERLGLVEPNERVFIDISGN